MSWVRSDEIWAEWWLFIGVMRRLELAPATDLATLSWVNNLAMTYKR